MLTRNLVRDPVSMASRIRGMSEECQRNRALLPYAISYQILRFMIKTFCVYWGSQGFYDKNEILVWIQRFQPSE